MGRVAPHHPVTTPPTHATRRASARPFAFMFTPSSNRLADADDRQMGSPSHEGRIQDGPGHSTQGLPRVTSRELPRRDAKVERADVPSMEHGYHHP